MIWFHIVCDRCGTLAYRAGHKRNDPACDVGRVLRDATRDKGAPVVFVGGDDVCRECFDGAQDEVTQPIEVKP